MLRNLRGGQAKLDVRRGGGLVKAGEYGQRGENFADVICVWPLEQMLDLTLF